MGRMSAPEATETLLTLRQTSQYLKASPSFVRKLVRKGLIPHYRLGQKILRFRKGELDAWLLGGKQCHG